MLILNSVVIGVFLDHLFNVQMMDADSLGRRILYQFI